MVWRFNFFPFFVSTSITLTGIFKKLEKGEYAKFFSDKPRNFWQQSIKWYFSRAFSGALFICFISNNGLREECFIKRSLENETSPWEDLSHLSRRLTVSY